MLMHFSYPSLPPATKTVPLETLELLQSYYEARFKVEEAISEELHHLIEERLLAKDLT